MNGSIVAFSVVLAALAGGGDGQTESATATAAASAASTTASADRAAIEQAARAFEAAFNKGDAKAIAAMYTERGESRDVGGLTLEGRAAIEKEYAAAFKASPGARIEVLIRSIRFPATNLAVEEGILRLARGPKDLPSTSKYVAVHSREAGQWRIALSSEGGQGEERLEDLDWLLGEWTTKTKNGTLSLAFARDPKKPVVTGTFTRTPTGKEPLRGTIRIAADPETGQIRSWGFEEDGAHSQSLWTCDGKSWILDARGVLADGTPAAERIVLQRVTADAITWRAIDRVLGNQRLADTPPMRLSRVKGSK